MPSIDRRLLRQTFEHKCGADVDQRDHTFYTFRIAGKRAAYTKISHARGDEPTPMVSAIARQLRLTSAELKQLVDCTLSAEAFYALLAERRDTRRRP